MYLYVDCLWIVLSMQYVFMHIGSMICKKIDVLGGIYSETGEFPIQLPVPGPHSGLWYQ